LYSSILPRRRAEQKEWGGFTFPLDKFAISCTISTIIQLLQ
jgi:hypothetical protein